MNLANHTTTSWGAGAPSTKQGSSGEKTRFNGFSNIIYIFNSSSSSQAVPRSVLLGPLSALEIEKTAERTIIHNATSHIDLQILTKVLNMSKLQNRLHQRVPIQSDTVVHGMSSFEIQLLMTTGRIRITW